MNVTLSRAGAVALVGGLVATLSLCDPAAADPLPDEVTAYVWANDPTSKEYTPWSPWTYNSAGGPVTVMHDRVGDYSVFFKGAGADGGVVHAVARGYDPAAVCTVVGWGRVAESSRDLRISVRCFGGGGAPRDMPFVASYTNAHHLDNKGRLTYLWADQPVPDGEYVLKHDYQYDSEGGRISYERIRTGHYVVDIEAAGTDFGPIFPMVHVTAVGTEWTHCEVDLAYGTTVNCVDLTGTPADSGFTLTYGRNVDLTGHTGGVFGSAALYQENISEDGYISGDDWLSTYPEGPYLTSRVVHTGLYEVNLRGLGTYGGHALVNSFGNHGSAPQGVCTMVGWWVSGVDELIQVSCTNLLGAPTNLNVRISFTGHGGTPV